LSNKDPDYAIRIEKAIKDKYGSETIANPSSSWNKEKELVYLEELREIYRNEQNTQEDESHKGILISKKLFNLKEDKNCKVCQTYRPKAIDKLYFVKYDCCSFCYYKYVIDREERWLSGWRPHKN